MTPTESAAKQVRCTDCRHATAVPGMRPSSAVRWCPLQHIARHPTNLRECAQFETLLA